MTAYYKDIFDYVTTKLRKSTPHTYQAAVFTRMWTKITLRLAELGADISKTIRKWFRGRFRVVLLIHGQEKVPLPMKRFSWRTGGDETIKEIYMSWDRPFQFNLMTTFNVAKNEPLFGFGSGILDNYPFYVHAFYE